MVKSASDYFDRLDNDPEFAREMSERQHRIGQWPRSSAYANQLCESDSKRETRDMDQVSGSGTVEAFAAETSFGRESSTCGIVRAPTCRDFSSSPT